MKVKSKREIKSTCNDKSVFKKPESDNVMLKNIGTEINIRNRKILKKQKIDRKKYLKDDLKNASQEVVFVLKESHLQHGNKGNLKHNKKNNKEIPNNGKLILGTKYKHETGSNFTENKKHIQFENSDVLHYSQSLSSDEKGFTVLHNKASSDNQAVTQEYGDISPWENQFMQQSGIHQGDSSVSKKVNLQIKCMSEFPASVSDKKSEERKKRKLPFSEKNDDSTDVIELYSGPIAQNDNLKLSHGGSESNKNEKFKKNCERLLETQSASTEIQTVPCAIRKKKLLGSVSSKKCLDFMKIPQQKLHGFEGREDTPERLSRTVFVGNLPLSFSRKLLQRLFQNFGEIESVRLRSVVPARSSLPKKIAVIREEFHNKSNSFNGYVVFRNIDDVENALTLNKTVVQGHHIRVDRFRENIVYDSKRSVFVGNLPYDTTTDSLWSVFGECGAIEAVRVIRDPETGLGKGFGFVLFEGCDSVQRALLLNETQVNGRNIRVKLVEKGNKSNVKMPVESQGANLKLKKKYLQQFGGQKKKINRKLMKRRISTQKEKYITSILTQ